MIELNDTKKTAIEKETILQVSFNNENFIVYYNALSVNCEQDWKVSATIQYIQRICGTMMVNHIVSPAFQLLETPSESCRRSGHELELVGLCCPDR